MLLFQARGLAGRGHEVVIEFPTDGPAPELARAEGLRVLIGRRSRLPRSAAEAVGYFVRAPRDVLALSRRFREQRCQLVWVHSLYNAPALFAARLAGIPAVWHLHERNLAPPLNVLGTLLVRGLSSTTLAVSSFVARSFTGDVRVLHNPAMSGARLHEPPDDTHPDTRDPVRTAAARVRSDGVGAVTAGRAGAGTPALDRAAAFVRDAPFVVGYVGQFEPRKRAGDVVAALGRLPACVALLVGDGKDVGSLEVAIERAGVGERVLRTGFQRDVEPFYRLMDCLVVPSRNEPFGLVVLEAMAQGVPVLVSASGALPEVAGDAALQFPLGSTEDLSEQIEHLRERRELRERLVRRGIRRLQAFDAEAWLDAVEATVHQCVEAAPAAGPDGRAA